MIKLWVSENCGMSYFPQETYDNAQEQAFINKTQELNRDLVRWYITDESGEMVDDAVSDVHKGIIAFLRRM